MNATLLAHAGHVAPHGGTEAYIGIALLLIGAATALWRTRRRDSLKQNGGARLRPDPYPPTRTASATTWDSAAGG